MKEETQERTILDAAIAAVYRTAGIKLKAHDEVRKGERILDAEITIEGNKKVRYAAEIKKWAQQANFGVIVNLVKQLPGKGMLVADYVDPKMADRLRELEIPYIDTVGNIYINEKPLYILVKTTRPPLNRYVDTPIRLRTNPQGRAFNPTGLRVLYQFIVNEKIVNAPYREIADKADVALGAIGWVINDLKQGGYLFQENKKKRRLTNKRKLLDKWVDGYLEKLRPKFFVGRFAAEDPQWWEKNVNKIAKYGAKWGGEIAANILTEYLVPQEITVYARKGTNTKLFAENRFRKDPKGEIYIYQAF